MIIGEIETYKLHITDYVKLRDTNHLVCTPSVSFRILFIAISKFYCSYGALKVVEGGMFSFMTTHILLPKLLRYEYYKQIDATLKNCQ